MAGWAPTTSICAFCESSGYFGIVSDRPRGSVHSSVRDLQSASLVSSLEMAEYKKVGRAQKLIVAGGLAERYRDEIRKVSAPRFSLFQIPRSWSVSRGCSLLKTSSEH